MSTPVESVSQPRTTPVVGPSAASSNERRTGGGQRPRGRGRADPAEQDTAALLADYARERGQGDLSSVGPAATLDGLALGQVETVLIDPSRTAGQTAWFGPELAQAAATREALEQAGVEPDEAPLDDVLVRAAAGTAATVRIVPPGAPELAPSGVGGLLRYRL